MRFNKDLKMNAGFGRGFSNFSTRQQQSIKQFHKDIQNVALLNQDFKTFDISNLTVIDSIENYSMKDVVRKLNGKIL